VADDRPADDVVDQLAAVTRDMKDLRETLLARASTRPTGTIELALAASADTLLLQGQNVSRTTYAALWAWAQAKSLVVTNVFDVGDGSTTFGLPDLRGRMPVGIGTLGTDTYALGNAGGAAFRSLATANMPAHDHGSGGSHNHGGNTNTTGSHGGHTSGTTNVVPPGSGITLPANYSGSDGSHSHSITTDTEPSHTHGTVGSGTAFDNRPPYFGLYWVIYV
jgi:microcystin-dependent protein